MPIRFALWLCVLALAIAAPVAADPGREILERTSQTYRGLTSYDFSGRIQVQVYVGKSTQQSEYTFRIAADSSGRAHEDFDQGSSGTRMIMNGKDLWRLAWPPKQWMRLPAPAPATTPDAPLATEIPGGLAAKLLADYRTMSTVATEVKYLREQPVTLGRKPRPCFVLEVTMPPPEPTPSTKFGPRTLWIDKETRLVLIQEAQVEGLGSEQQTAWTRTETLTIDDARVGRRLADSLFTFTAPADAQEVKNFGPQSSQRVDLSGQPAKDFTLVGLDGAAVTLSKLRGKVVLLDFWATWCGPCRIEMPRVEKLHQEFKGKGLIVLGVNLREAPERARAFMKKNGYTFGSLLDAKAEVADRYQVDGIPTLLVIDRKGQIAAHFVGVREEQDLRDALKKAGLE